MLLGIFENVDKDEKKTTVEHLIKTSSPSQDYFLMVIFSVSMATLGILLDSIIILIGSMLIAPVLYPVLGIGMGIAIFDKHLILRSVYTLIQSVAVALLYAVLISFIFYDPHISDLGVVNTVTSIESYYMSLLVAVIAGFAASFSLVKPELSESLPGVAVSVALVPPLALAGVAGTQLSLEFTRFTILLFFSNVFGIVASSSIVFLLMNFHVSERVAEKAIAEEEKIIREENK